MNLELFPTRILLILDEKKAACKTTSIEMLKFVKFEVHNDTSKGWILEN